MDNFEGGIILPTPIYILIFPRIVQCLTHGKASKNICPLNQWMNKSTLTFSCTRSFIILISINKNRIFRTRNMDVVACFTLLDWSKTPGILCLVLSTALQVWKRQSRAHLKEGNRIVKNKKQCYVKLRAFIMFRA